MRAFFWVCLVGAAALVVLLACPPAMTWVHAVLQEPDYAPGSLFRSGSLWSVVGILAGVSALLVALTRRVLMSAPPQPARVPEFAGDESGALVFEFALVFPFILSLMFILFQWAEVLMADSLLHYAAFCTARTASMYAAETEGSARYNLSGKMPKLNDSAKFALSPAMALEGRADHKAIAVTLLTPEDVQVTPNRKYRTVGVNLEWGYGVKWPIISLFFRPLLADGRIPMSRSYSMDVEPYLESRRLTDPQIDQFRHNITRLALHDTLLRTDHKLLTVDPASHPAREKFERKVGKCVADGAGFVPPLGPLAQGDPGPPNPTVQPNQPNPGDAPEPPPPQLPPPPPVGP